MKRRKPDAALSVLRQSAHLAYRQIMSREAKIAELQEEIRVIRAHALMPLERMCEERGERVESEQRSQWISEPLPREWAD